MQEYVYFLQITEKGPIKIGLTRNVQRRLKQAQTFNYEKVKLLGYIEGSQSLETKLIHRYAEYQIRGEWFSYNLDLNNLAKGIYDGEYLTEGSRSYVILYRDTPRSPTDPCPFCCLRHNHGIGDGHRAGHCATNSGRSFVSLPSGQILYRDHGYFIKTRNPNSTELLKERMLRAVSKTRLNTYANLLTFAVNKFIEFDVFTLDPSTKPPEGGATLLVDYPDGTPCKVRCYDAGYDEVGLQVLYGIKKPDPPVYTFVSRQSKEICSVHATGWLERKTGKYLQIPINSTSVDLYCGQKLCKHLAELEIKPILNSFHNRGPFHL